MIKLITSSAILFFLVGNLYAQQGANAAGGDASSTGGSISYTIGQVDYMNVESSDGSIYYGIQQPYEISTLTGIEVKDIELNFSVYPNPSTDYIKLSVGKEYLEKITYSMYDMVGKQIMHENIVASETMISMIHLADAAYILKIYNANNSEIKSFKIITNK